MPRKSISFLVTISLLFSVSGISETREEREARQKLVDALVASPSARKARKILGSEFKVTTFNFPLPSTHFSERASDFVKSLTIENWKALSANPHALEALREIPITPTHHAAITSKLQSAF